MTIGIGTFDSSATSGFGVPQRRARQICAIVLGELFSSGTVATYQFENSSECDCGTQSGVPFVFTDGNTASTSSEGTSKSIMELRRLSGLTWEQLAKLFGVARRSLHFWASGKPLNSSNSEHLSRVLAAVRKADRGFALKNRAMLLQDHEGVIPFDLLVNRDYDTFLSLVGIGPGRVTLDLRPLSPEAQAARKPQPPEELVGALQDTIHKGTGIARAAKSVRVPRDRG